MLNSAAIIFPIWKLRVDSDLRLPGCQCGVQGLFFCSLSHPSSEAEKTLKSTFKASMSVFVIQKYRVLDIAYVALFKERPYSAPCKSTECLKSLTVPRTNSFYELQAIWKKAASINSLPHP